MVGGRERRNDCKYSLKYVLQEKCFTEGCVDGGGLGG